LFITHANGEPAKYHRLDQIPEYFRRVYKDCRDWSDNLYEALLSVLENKLLYGGPEVGIGEDYPDYFFCATVDDEDLPWDRTQVDW
jgi:hypothetical protein